MKKTLKRLLACSLSFTICISQLPYAFATNHTAEEDAAYDLQERGIMVGDENGNMQLDRGLTRAELAVLLTRLAGNIDHVIADQDYYISRCEFADVPAWARLYVGYCYSVGFVSGYGNGYYGSNDRVTPSAACTVLLRYLECPDTEWTYATACKKATELGLCEEEMLSSSEVRRGTMALMIHRALTSPGNSVSSADKSIPSAELNLTAVPSDGSLYVPNAGDKILCDDGSIYTIKDVSRYDTNVFASGPVGPLPEATCNWDQFTPLVYPSADVRRITDGSRDLLFVRNLYESRRMAYTLYNSLGNEPTAWKGNTPLATVELSIPAELELYTSAFWPWRESELTDLVKSRPNSRFYTEAWDYYLNGVFQYTRYCIVSE